MFVAGLDPTAREVVEHLRSGLWENVVVSTFSDLSDLLPAVSAEAPDVVVCDYEVSAGRGFIEHRFPDGRGAYPAPVVALVAAEDERPALRLLARGVSEILCRTRLGPDVLAIAVLRALARGSVAGSRQGAAPSAVAPSKIVLDQLLRSVPVGVFWKDREGRFQGANWLIARLAGLKSPEALVGRKDDDLPWGNRAQSYREDDLQVLESGATTDSAQRLLRTAEGTDLMVEVSKAPLRGARGDVTGVLSILTDLTSRIESERELRLLSRAVEESTVLILIADPNWVIQYVNPRWCEVTGYSRREAEGKTPRLVKSGKDSPGMLAELDGTLARGQAWRGRLVNRRKDGTEYVEEKTVTAIRGRNGEIQHYLSFGADISHLVGLQEQLIQAQKMEAVGRLTGGVAHDFNNLLGVVLTGVDLVSRALPDMPEIVQKDLADIREAVVSGRTLVSALLAYSRRSRLSPELVSLGSELERHVPVLRRGLRDDIELRLLLEGGVPATRVDVAALHQILLNVVTNAQDAMPLGGRIDLSVAPMDVGDAYLKANPWCRRGRYGLIAVADGGTGMDRDTLKRVFDPFFTTKGPDRGTGLGLAMAFGLMKLHSGFINIDSHKGAGTTVHLLFPATEVGATGSAQAQQSSAGVQGPEQASSAARKPIALTVEDNRPLRRAGKRILEAEGYEVLEAGDGVEALEIFGAQGGKVAVVISDLMMPRMGGAELYRRLTNEYGHVPFVVSSGHVDEAADLRDSLPRDVPYILKPWTAQDLVLAVREATAVGGP